MSAFGTPSYGNDVVDGGADFDTVNFSTGTPAQSAVMVDLATGSITGGGAGGVGSASVTSVEQVITTDFNDQLSGSSGAETLDGRGGNDTLSGGGGNDTLIGGTGNDSYRFGSGHGADTIQENDATSGNTDIAQFLSGIARDQVWFQHSGNNLVVSVIGTSDQFTVQDWYVGTQYKVEQFKTAAGDTLLESQVQNLVNAMAAFSPPAPGQTTLPAEYAAQLNPVIAANWQ
jgi:Ca2+-binding RTX toxin-like protein